MGETQLVSFISEAKKRGFSESAIRQALKGEGWSEEEISEGLSQSLALLRLPAKNQVTIYLDDAVLSAISKRAKRNLLSVSAQIEDIVRRSAVNTGKGALPSEKLDDLLVAIFSRKTRKR